MAGNKGGIRGVESRDTESMNPVMVQNYLEGLDYPASKDEILQIAEEQDAPERVLSVLEDVADKEYKSPAELTKELSQLM